MAIEVIGAGFGRPCTRSLKAAMKILGYTQCWHTVEVFGHPEQMPKCRPDTGST